MYADLDNTVFVSTHVKGHGTLGNLYYNKTSTLPMGGIPSVLYMFSPLVGGVGTGTIIAGDYTVDLVYINTWREQ